MDPEQVCLRMHFLNGVCNSNASRLVELGEDFVRLLRLRFPHARIVKCDAARMREAGMDTDLRYGAVISGLPLLAMQPPVVFRIVKEAVRRLGVRTRAVRNRTLRTNGMRTYAAFLSLAGRRSDRNPFGI